MKNIVLLLRASSAKQNTDGDTLDAQKALCEREVKKHSDWKIVKIFKFIESATIDDRVFFREVLDFCLDKKNEVNIVLCRDTARFTRQGDDTLIHFIKLLEDEGVMVKDLAGIISYERVNVFEEYGHDYDFGIINVGEDRMRQQAIEDAKYAKTASRLMRGGILHYACDLGYKMSPNAFGVTGAKMVTPHGTRVVPKEIPEESFFVKKAFELRLQGMTYKQIAQAVNKLGAKTRDKHRLDKYTKRPIAIIKGKPLIPQSIENILSRTLYCGILTDKHVQGKGFRDRALKIPYFDGFIPIDSSTR